MSYKDLPNRREFISKTTGAAAIASLGPGTAPTQTQQATPQSKKRGQRKERPNILILCMDQWQTYMELPRDVRLPAMRRLESNGVSFDRQYCTVPICTPSRATMWTGVHAKHTGLWDNTNFAWIGELSREIPTIGHLLRDQGYYTAFKGKWRSEEHTSELQSPVHLVCRLLLEKKKTYYSSQVRDHQYLPYDDYDVGCIFHTAQTEPCRASVAVLARFWRRVAPPRTEVDE